MSETSFPDELEISPINRDEETSELLGTHSLFYEKLHLVVVRMVVALGLIDCT